MTRVEDLAELGLNEHDEVDQQVIRKTYLRLSRTRHPDKGGTKESFQLLVNAYERLRSGGCPDTAAAARPEDNDREEEDDGFSEYEQEFWYEVHYNFFRRAWEFYDFDDDDDSVYEDYYDNWHESASEKARRRRQERKQGYDWRDRTASPEDETCMFCGENQPITEREAIVNGINWEEYSAHPEGFKTCWICKDNHVSVMTKSMALKKFAKKLDYTRTSQRTGVDYHPAFWFLKLDHRSFHHQPVVTGSYDGPVRNNEYYWYPDLESGALALGWKPRGKKKDEVPWVQKNRPTALVPYSKCPSATSSGKRKARGKDKISLIIRVTPEKKRRRNK